MKNILILIIRTILTIVSIILFGLFFVPMTGGIINTGNIAIVTDGFHQLRVRIIARQLGIKENVGAVNSDTSLLYLPTFTVREWFALPYQVLFR